jgi:putative tryptophan/tyrosine transport system substrate-binding protein
MRLIPSLGKAMRRRDLVKGIVGSTVGWPLAARAQQSERVRRIGVLMASAADDSEPQARMAAFLQGLAQLGWIDGRNVRIDTRWATTNADDLRRHAAELAALAPDVILAASGTSTVAPLLQATRTVPIVFVVVIDPVGAGFVASLARPGGNATGFLMFEYGLSGKWLELLKQVAPGVTRAAVLRDAAIASGIGQFAAVQAVAPSLGVELSPVDARDAPEIERAVTAFPLRQWRPDRDAEPSGKPSSQSDRHASGPARVASGLWHPPIRRRRRPDLLWARYGRTVPASRRLRRSHPQGREAG